MARRSAAEHDPRMDPTVGSSEELPALYRSILGLVEELERCDRRREAAGIRTQAIAAYETAWDGRQRRRLPAARGPSATLPRIAAAPREIVAAAGLTAFAG